MNTNIYELKEWQSNARRELSSKQDALRDEMEQIGNYMRALDVTDELCAEIDNLNDQLADKQAEIDDLMAQLEEKQAENDSLHGEHLHSQRNSAHRQMGHTRRPPSSGGKSDLFSSVFVS